MYDMKAIQFLLMLGGIIKRTNPNVGNHIKRQIMELYGYKVISPATFDKAWIGSKNIHGLITHIDKEKTSYNSNMTGVVIRFKPTACGGSYYGSKNYLELLFDGRYRNSSESDFQFVDCDQQIVFSALDDYSIPIELLIMIASNIIDGYMLNTYENIVVYAKDGSINSEIREWLGIKADYHLHNLEFTTEFDSFKHYDRIKPLYEITGHLYAISANDFLFDTVYHFNKGRADGGQKIIDYCNTHFPCIK